MDNGRLIVHLVTALVAALVGASVAVRLRQPLILGYILAGVAIGRFTPGFIGSAEATAELAEVVPGQDITVRIEEEDRVVPDALDQHPERLLGHRATWTARVPMLVLVVVRHSAAPPPQSRAIVL